MHLPATTIWGTRIQAVCSVIAARDGNGVELWMCANYGQVSLDPPRVIINPNRVYPIEEAIRRSRRFSLNVLPVSARLPAIRLIRARRREPDKPGVMGLSMPIDARHDIPFLERALQTLFCEVEDILDTGDHTVMIARVLETREDPSVKGEAPLLYPEISPYADIAREPSRFPQLARALRVGLTVTGATDALRRVLQRYRGAAKVDLPGATYRAGGQTGEE